MKTAEIKATKRALESLAFEAIGTLMETISDMNLEIRDLQAELCSPMYGPGIEDPDF